MRRRRSHGNSVCWDLNSTVNVSYITYEDKKEIDHLEDLRVEGEYNSETVVNEIFWKGIVWPVVGTSEDGNILWIAVRVQ